MKKILVLSLMVFLMAGMTFTVRAEEPIKIGIVTSMSGPLEYYGTMEIRGFELGIEYATGGTNQVLGRPIEILTEDSGMDPGTGVTKARELIERHGVHFLQGTASSAVALAIQDVALEYERIFMVAPAAADSITGVNWNRYTFRTASTTTQDALTGGVYAAREIGEEFVIFVPDSAWGRDTAKAWRAAIEGEGGTIINEIFVAPDASDFTPYLLRLMQDRPDAAVVAWAGAGGIQLFDQIDEYNLYDYMAITSGFGDIPALRAMGDSIIGAQGMMKYFHTLPDNEINDWLVEKYTERYGTPPDLFVPDAFAAAVALVQAIETAGTIDTDTLIETMRGMEFDTPKGKMIFRPEDHQALQHMYVVEMQKVEGYDYPVPVLLMEMSLEDTAPPITVGD